MGGAGCACIHTDTHTHRHTPHTHVRAHTHTHCCSILPSRFGGSDGDGIFYVPSCHGWESKLVDCDHIPVAREYCGRDVAVECCEWCEQGSLWHTACMILECPHGMHVMCM